MPISKTRRKIEREHKKNSISAQQGKRVVAVAWQETKHVGEIGPLAEAWSQDPQADFFHHSDFDMVEALVICRKETPDEEVALSADIRGKIHDTNNRCVIFANKGGFRERRPKTREHVANAHAFLDSIGQRYCLCIAR